MSGAEPDIGCVVAWDCAIANVPDKLFHPLIRQFEERMIILSDMGFHAAEGDPANLKLCQHGEWNDRILMETVLAMLTVGCRLRKSCTGCGRLPHPARVHHSGL